jgi:hypothetical protein
MAEDIAELPPYRAVLVVDTKEFGSNSAADQEVLAELIPDVLWTAFERAGLAHIYDNALFPHNTGDGFGLGFDTRYLPAVVTRFFDALETVLAQKDKRLREHGRGIRMRMRASLNVGPVREVDRRTDVAVVGSTIITTHLLLDAPAVREILVRSDPDRTFVAVALSQRVFEDVLASGYGDLPASRVVPRVVQVKEYTGTVYLYVPNPTGDLLTVGFGDGEQYEQQLTEAQSVPPPAPGGTTNIMTGTHSGTAIQVGNLYGGVHQGGTSISGSQNQVVSGSTVHGNVKNSHHGKPDSTR